MPFTWNPEADFIVKPFMIEGPRKTRSSTLLKALLIAAAVVLLVYIRHRENQINDIAGCYDCGWNMRQALLLVIGTVFLLFDPTWTAVVAFLSNLKVIYSIGYVAFF